MSTEVKTELELRRENEFLGVDRRDRVRASETARYKTEER